MNHCPHCRKPLPSKLRWTTRFAGQTAHTCPRCRKRFRLTYAAKRRLAALNLVLILGFIVLWFFPDIPRNLLVYLVIALVALALMPTQTRYEKLSKTYD